MGKTRGLFKKIRDTKGTFHAKMGTVKDRNFMRLPCSSNGKEYACEEGDQGSIPGLESFSGGGNGNPLQYSCLENSMDREAWQDTVYGVTKSQTRLSD